MGACLVEEIHILEWPDGGATFKNGKLRIKSKSKSLEVIILDL